MKLRAFLKLFIGICCLSNTLYASLQLAYHQPQASVRRCARHYQSIRRELTNKAITQALKNSTDETRTVEEQLDWLKWGAFLENLKDCTDEEKLNTMNFAENLHKYSKNLKTFLEDWSLISNIMPYVLRNNYLHNSIIQMIIDTLKKFSENDLEHILSFNGFNVRRNILENEVGWTRRDERRIPNFHGNLERAYRFGFSQIVDFSGYIDVTKLLLSDYDFKATFTNIRKLNPEGNQYIIKTKFKMLPKNFFVFYHNKYNCWKYITSDSFCIDFIYRDGTIFFLSAYFEVNNENEPCRCDLCTKWKNIYGHRHGEFGPIVASKAFSSVSKWRYRSSTLEEKKDN